MATRNHYVLYARFLKPRENFQFLKDLCMIELKMTSYTYIFLGRILTMKGLDTVESLSAGAA